MSINEAKSLAASILPEDYKAFAFEVFAEAAMQMDQKGFSEDEIVDLLSSLRGAVADSYGD